MSIFLTSNAKTNKKLIYFLREIYGLGLLVSKNICKNLGYDYNIQVNQLREKDLNKINSLITVKYKILIDSELKKNIYDNIKKMKNINSYKGLRHRYNLPANGQRTRTNAKTRI